MVRLFFRSNEWRRAVLVCRSEPSHTPAIAHLAVSMSMSVIAPQDARVRWKRWLLLIASFGVCLFTFSIWVEGEPTWPSALWQVAGVGCLAFGIYVFFKSGARARG